MTFIDTLKSKLQSSPAAAVPATGLFHYVRENEQEKSRVHLRIDPDGSGTLIVNASSVMHLNPTAAYMAWLVLEHKSEQESVTAITRRYSVSKSQARSDLSAFSIQLDELMRPEGTCPVHELDLESMMPFSARPSAPYRMDLAVTYRCNNDCPTSAKILSSFYLVTDQWQLLRAAPRRAARALHTIFAPCPWPLTTAF